MVALQQPNGRMRGLVVGNVMRRPKPSPGKLRSSSFDHVSGLSSCRTSLAPLPRFVRQFMARPRRTHGMTETAWRMSSKCRKHDEKGRAGDPLMPGLLALAQHPASHAGRALPGEAQFA